ncbi:hypothetical protein ENSA7_40560 [Enhygromyxa salina]|uniref:Uncharacterized protein n=1 Tax=Enhygromyxa salina TaxID=215803 RepID=A0A2S9YMA2_9BACT|nr:hypothetical protein ENSA7_40560 [Enhygromyxa salina]
MAFLVLIVSAFHGASLIPAWKQAETQLRGWLVDSDLLGSAQDLAPVLLVRLAEIYAELG